MSGSPTAEAKVVARLRAAVVVGRTESVAGLRGVLEVRGQDDADGDERAQHEVKRGD